MLPTNPEMVCEAIARRRIYGRLTCVVRDQHTEESANQKGFLSIIDEFVQGFGFKGLGDSWIEISAEAAKAVAREVLFRDLAYRAAMMSEQESRDLSDAFVSLFAGSTRFFTNGNLIVPDADPSEVPGSWTANSEATFDTGIVCLGNARIGILWVEDED